MAGKEDGGRGRVRSGDYITGCHELGGLEHTHKEQARRDGYTRYRLDSRYNEGVTHPA